MALRKFTTRIPGEENRKKSGLHVSELAKKQEEKENPSALDDVEEYENDEGLDPVDKRRSYASRFDEGFDFLSPDY